MNSARQAIIWKDYNGVYLGCNGIFARAGGEGGMRAAPVGFMRHDIFAWSGE